MRIIAGEHRGRALTPVGKGDAGAHLRPTTDRVRESLFSMLGGGRFGAPFDGTRVLDLFAGTGALGLEALSRGAAEVVFVDDGRKAGQLIRANIALLREADRARLIACNATRLPANADAPYDLVFLDPPYGKALGAAALAAAAKGGWIAPEALVVWEERAAQVAPEGFALLEARKYGDTVISLMAVEN
ncbi:16S rRNA (guanine(966)-N(2))-methyltransferase RsmD [Marinovum sp.]|uniref:16S rRNA (guanine(966)-N(2))-methyltransferase RsmD n=1 Tax=Marinovum sp. TaxID=2024839 RepID=UPI002B2710E7|nr:16S rRNA (guanine(966)-N(2))-methyltransferase RsmD [Marinovum sp.]